MFSEQSSIAVCSMCCCIVYWILSMHLFIATDNLNSFFEKFNSLILYTNDQISQARELVNVYLCNVLNNDLKKSQSKIIR